MRNTRYLSRARQNLSIFPSASASSLQDGTKTLECTVQAMPVSVPVQALPLEGVDAPPPTVQPGKQEEMPAVTSTSLLQMVQHGSSNHGSSNHQSSGETVHFPGRAFHSQGYLSCLVAGEFLSCIAPRHMQVARSLILVCFTTSSKGSPRCNQSSELNWPGIGSESLLRRSVWFCASICILAR